MSPPSFRRSINLTAMFGKDIDTSAALIHAGMAMLVALYVIFSGYSSSYETSQHKFTLALSLAFLLYCTVLVISNFVWPGPYTLRRILTMVVDCTVISLGLFLADQMALPFLGGYLWIIIANGLRYGRKYLIATNLLAILSFLVVITFSQYWNNNLILALSNLFWMSLLPAYFIKLLNNLQVALQQAQHANQIKNQFLANMSHELRTPLSAILGYSEMLAEDAQQLQNIPLATDLHKIHSAAQYLLTSINAVLELARLEAGQVIVDRTDFHLPDCIDVVVNSIRPLLQLKQNSLHVLFQSEITLVNTDQALLQKALLNLLNNANKFTHQGQITLSINSTRGLDRTSWLEIKIIDTGIGIDANKLSHLFEPFVQADTSSTRKYEGTGLGLTITAQLAQLLGGSINVDSEPGCGSTFSLSIPVIEPLDKPRNYFKQTPLRSNKQSVKSNTPPVERRIKVSRILIIMADSADCSRVQKTFSAMKLPTTFASSVSDALHSIRSQSPDLIVLDMRAAQNNDIKLIQDLNAELSIASIPILLLTVADQLVPAEINNATTCIRLPLDVNALATAIVAQLRRTTTVHMLVVSDDIRFYTALQNVCSAIHIFTQRVASLDFQPGPEVLQQHTTLLLDLTHIDSRKLRLLKTLTLHRSQAFQILCLLPNSCSTRIFRTVAARCNHVILNSDFGLDETLIHIIEYINAGTNNNYGLIDSSNYSPLRVAL